MRKIIFLTVLISMLSCGKQKDTNQKNDVLNKSTTSEFSFSRTYFGYIDDEYPITMDLISKNNKLSGSYKYDETGVPIRIEGAIKGDSIYINGFDPQGEKIDQFKGLLQEQSIEGEWYGLTNNTNFQFYIVEVEPDNNYSDAITEQNYEKEKVNNTDPDFPITEFLDAGFIENIPEYRYEGSSFQLKMRMKNNTPNVIRRFKLNYYIKLTMKDGTYGFHPASFFGDENDNIKKFDSYDIMSYNLPYDSIWKPGEVRNMILTVPKDIVAGFNCNFPPSDFERTPSQAILAYRYNAISVDKEYQNIESYDILKFWKNHQSEIGLR